jgi:hypothetical protein
VTPAKRIIRAALQKGVLRLNNQGWRYGRRRFAFKTVARLIAAGEAIRDGNTVRAT